MKKTVALFVCTERMTQLINRLTVLAALIVVGSSDSFAQVAYHVMALSGEPAPGTSDRFVSFANPVINAPGNVAFQANLTGPTTDVVPHGIWAGSPVSLRSLAVAGHVAPGVGSARFRTPGWPIVLTDDGQVLFYAQLVQAEGVTFDNDYGIWAGEPDNVHLVSRRSEPAPGLPPGVNYELFFANPHASGRMGFSASLQGSSVNATNNSAAWTGSLAPDSLQLIARAGDAAPSLPNGWRYSSLGTPLVNVNGQIALLATAASDDLSPQQMQGIWAGRAGDLSLVASSSNPAPGTPERSFSFFNEPRLNNLGQIAFLGFLESATSEEQLSDVGIWAGPATADGIRAIAIEGQQAPGLSSGVVFRGSSPGDEVTYDAFTNAVLGGGGHVAFAGTVFGDNIDFDHNDGVWVSEPLNASAAPDLALIAREGDRPPGTPEGTSFVGIFFDDDLIPAFERPSINAVGQVAFEASTDGPLGPFGRGIWATDPFGSLQLVAHTGDTLLVAPGDAREIALLKMHAGGSSANGQLSAINDSGQLAFSVRFTDSTEAVIVATVVAEPSATSLVAILVFCLAIGRVIRMHCPRKR